MFGQQNQFLEGVDAVGQAIATRLRLLLGEWWENTEDGLPLFQEILGLFRPENEVEDVDLIISERINDTEGVTEILSFDSQYSQGTRTYSAKCSVQTVYGVVDISIQNLSQNNVVVKVV